MQEITPSVSNPNKMVAKAHAATLSGIEAVPVVVELHVKGASESKFIIVGLPDQAVNESNVRVRSAIQNCDFNLPCMMFICNLAPGDVRKEGPFLDLPIAVAVLAATGQVVATELENTLLLGELGLDGNLRPINGAVSVALMAAEMGFKRLILPKANASEAAVAPDIDVYGMDSLLDVVHLLNGDPSIQPVRLSLDEASMLPHYEFDYSDVKGQRHAVRALEISAGGGHNILMVGPPGSGKTMLARRLPTIMPQLTLQESIEVTRIYSSSGQMGNRQGLIWERPFRPPHHSASHAAVVGGGKVPKPGEVSLAHKGVLFFDEMPEFDRSVLEALRQPLEDNVVTVSRVHSSMCFPAEFMLVGAMNPCPCGFKGLPEQRCISNPTLCARYAGKISGPLLDRIDLHIEVPRLKPEELLAAADGESSEAIRERVCKTREAQYARLGHGKLNSKMSPREIRELIPLTDECKEFMRLVMNRMNISARVFDRILKVGRTIADMAGHDEVSKQHLSEAVQYRERVE